MRMCIMKSSQGSKLDEIVESQHRTIQYWWNEGMERRKDMYSIVQILNSKNDISDAERLEQIRIIADTFLASAK